MNIVKWWKDKTFLSIFGVALITMLLGFLMAYFITWGWIVTIFIGISGGLIIRRIIVKKLDELSNTTENKN